MSFLKCNANVARASANIPKNTGFDSLSDEVDEEFRFRTGNQDSLINFDLASVKFHLSKDVLEGFPFASAGEELAEEIELGVLDGFIILEIEIHPLEAQDMREEIFGGPLGTVDAA